MNTWPDRVDLAEKMDLYIGLYPISCTFSSPMISCPGYLMSGYKR